MRIRRAIPLMFCLILISGTQVYAGEPVAELFNRLYGDVFLYTSRHALENRLHEMESDLRNIRIVEGVNSATEIQNDFYNTAIEERLDRVLYISGTIQALYDNYMSALLTTDLDNILTAKTNLENVLLTNETHITFNAGVLEQLFAPVFLELPPGNALYLEAEIYRLRAEIQMAPNYDLGNIPSAFPVEGRISSHFGFRNDPITGQRAWHTGPDISAAEDTPVYAWFNGTVRNASVQGGFGLQVTTVQDSVMVRYAHLSEVYVEPGQYVVQGDLIGRVGSTGRSTGPHLHLGLYLNNTAVNPYFILSRR